MSPKRAAFWVTAVFSLSIRLALSDWREKPSDAWTWRDVFNVLNSSPWVRVSSASFGAPAAAVTVSEPRQYHNYILPHFAVIRLLAAKPVADAFLRAIVLRKWQIDIKQLSGDKGDGAGLALGRFATFNADDLSTTGHREHIVIAITLAASFSALPPRVYPRSVKIPNPFETIEESDIVPVSFLSTRTGKRFTLVHYSPPGKDGLGARFFFPRVSPEGAPAIVKEDKELRFETCIKDRKIQVKFDLSKLVYQGRLEL